jgi:hypothetical protein
VRLAFATICLDRMEIAQWGAATHGFPHLAGADHYTVPRAGGSATFTGPSRQFARL